MTAQHSHCVKCQSPLNPKGVWCSTCLDKIETELGLEEEFYNRKLGIPHTRNTMKLSIVAGRMSRETKHSAAFDIFYDNPPVGTAGELLTHVITDMPITIPTGLFTVFEPGYVAIIKEKSGLALKGVELHGGVIDADYRQEWKVIARFAPHTDCEPTTGYKISHEPGKRVFIVNPGDKIAQVIFVKLADIECESPGFITKDQIRVGGLGSTGVT